MRQEEILDYEEVQESEPSKAVLLVRIFFAGLIAALLSIPVLLLLCFNIDPLGIKAQMKQDEDTRNAQDGN